MVGIIYVLVWEGIAAGLSTALATFSIRRYVQALLDSRLDSARLSAIQPINITGGTGLLVLVLIIAAGIAGTTMLLRRLELP